MQLHFRLRGWLAQPGDDDDRIDGVKGKTGGRKKWISIKDGGKRSWINADTERKGAKTCLRLVEQFGNNMAWGIDPDWEPKPDVKSSDPRVVYGPGFLPATAFFMYTKQ